MSLVLVRHAETDLNAGRVLQWPDTPLSARGRAQAQALGARFAGSPPAAIASSDMARAAQTARAVSIATGVPVLESPLLAERDFGELRGRPYDSLGFDPIADERAPPGGESMAAFRARVAQAMDWLHALRRDCGGDLLVVTHGLVLRVILEHHLSFDDTVPRPAALANTSVCIAGAEPPHRVRLAGCVRHLEGAARDDGRGVAGV